MNKENLQLETSKPFGKFDVLPMDTSSKDIEWAKFRKDTEEYQKKIIDSLMIPQHLLFTKDGGIVEENTSAVFIKLMHKKQEKLKRRLKFRMALVIIFAVAKSFYQKIRRLLK